MPGYDLQLDRIQLPTIADDLTELVGEQIGANDTQTQYGNARAFQVNIPVYASPTITTDIDLPNVGDRKRRQVRSLMENSDARQSGYYLNFTVDSEQNSWLVPGQGDLAAVDGGKTLGEYQLRLANALILGRRRLHRIGRRLELYDRRLSTTPRDSQAQVYSTDFAGMTALVLHALPTTVTNVTASLGAAVAASASRTAREGAVPIYAGRVNNDVLTFEQAEADQFKNDVVIRDRRGTLGYGYTVVTQMAMLGAPTLLAYWRGYELSGTTATDASGNARNGTYAGGFTLGQPPATADGSPSVLLDGVNGRITTTYSPFAAGSIRTFAGWVNRRTAPSNDVIFGGDGANHPLLRVPGGTPDMQFYAANGSGSSVTWAGAWPGQAQWVHFALIYDDSTRQATLYVNGVSKGTQTIAGGGGYTGTAGNFEIGARGGTTDPWDGYVEDVAVWGGALTATQISQLWSNGLPSADPEDAFGWEEVYGADWPFSADVPVLDNGLCRVRYDTTNTPGFRVDVWDGTKWAEQGKVTLHRRSTVGSNAIDTLVSTSVLEWTHERGAIVLYMRASADATSSERVVISLRRGWNGPRFEVYPAPNADGSNAGADVTFASFTADANTSFAKLDAGPAGATQATAGGGALNANVGAGLFTGENWLAVLRQGAAYSAVLSVLQAAAVAFAIAGDTSAYGSARSSALIYLPNANTTGYMSGHLGFYAQVADQVMEAESMTLGAGTSSTADGAASNGNAATSTRTADAIHVSRATWPNLQAGKYRVFARVKTSASTLNIYAKNGAGTGATVTTTSAAYVWLDLGELTAAFTTLEIHAWASAAATISVDRIEAHKVEDRINGAASLYDGARDHGAAELSDTNMVGVIVPRA